MHGNPNIHFRFIPAKWKIQQNGACCNAPYAGNLTPMPPMVRLSYGITVAIADQCSSSEEQAYLILPEEIPDRPVIKKKGVR